MNKYQQKNYSKTHNPNLGVVNKDIDNEQPKDKELEEAVIGALILNSETIWQVINILSVDDFYYTKHQHIYKAIINLFAENSPIDMLLVTQNLRKNNLIEEVGGSAEIMRLVSVINSTLNVEYYARIIVESSIKRKVIETSRTLLAEAYEESSDCFELLDKAVVGFEKIQDNLELGKTSDNKTIIDIIFKNIEDNRLSGNKVIGISTGFEELDNVIGGFQDKHLIYYGARPSTGKTYTMLNYISNQLDLGYNCGMISLESSSTEIMKRLLVLELNKNQVLGKNIIMMDLILGRLSDKQLETIKEFSNDVFAQKYRSDKFMLSDDPADAMSINTKARNWRRKNDMSVLYLDYLQRIDTDYLLKRGYENRNLELGQISKSLKQTAKNLEIPVVVCSQLSRDADEQGKKGLAPSVRHFRDSGEIEADADVMITLFSPSKYDLKDYLNEPSENLLIKNICKNRDGALKEVLTDFKGSTGICKSYNPYMESMIKNTVHSPSYTEEQPF